MCVPCALQKLGQPIQDRYAESEERPKAFEELGKQIQQYMKFIEAYKMKVTNIYYSIKKCICF